MFANPFLPQEHTGENISDTLTETLESWNLNPQKQVCITTDNRSNMINGVNSGPDFYALATI